MNRKKVLAAVCTAALLALSGCSDSFDYEDDFVDAPLYEEPAEKAEKEPDTESYSDMISGSAAKLSMSVDENGRLSINRSFSGSSPMGEDGTWTILIWLCGTDLESGSGFATGDIEEMLEASTGSNVSFVLQTGGTDTWQNSVMDSSGFQRYVISDGEIELCDEQTAASMGSAEPLADFIKWGVKSYPAAKMGLIFWDHGGGSISGVCFDEQYGYDSLSLTEIDSALSAASASMTDRFEFIGFDACLMGTVETANILATYSRYMYGSDHPDACGLAAYYPLELQGSSELKIFGDVSISPYYLSFVDRTIYGNNSGENTDDYDNSSIFVFWGSDDHDDPDYWDEYEDCQSSGDSPLIQFDTEPQLFEDGTLGFALTDESLEYSAAVEAVVMMISDDGEYSIELGLGADIYCDWETGIFTDNFDGNRFSLPDGQRLAVYILLPQLTVEFLLVPLPKSVVIKP